MITSNTVFILGAGASAPYNFPQGEKLRKEIINEIEKDVSLFLDQIKIDNKYRRDYLQSVADFKEAFSKSSIKSIEHFISLNHEYRNIGKMAILFRIINAERKSKFREDVDDLTKDWYFYLYNLLIEEIIQKNQINDFSKNKISFITLNYDRSLEHFLFESLKYSFNGTPEENIIEELNKIKIIHLFGQVANLNWQDKRAGVPYTSNLDESYIYKLDFQGLINHIIIFEEINTSKLEDAKKLIKNAQKIFFLGFSFSEEILKLLDISNIINDYQKIFGTVIDLEDREIAHKKNLFIKNHRVTDSSTISLKNIILEKVDCLKLLKKHL